MTTTITYRGELVVLKCWCGIQHAVPDSLRSEQRRQHDANARDVMGIFCPLGHQHVPSGKSATDRLTEEKERLERVIRSKEESLTIVRNQRDSAQRSNAALKAVVTRTKKRVGNGTCPCCNRHFVNVERHMKSQHPQYAADPEPSS